ncbi:MAG: glycosyltransferase [Flavobacteriales bacterium]
MNGYLAAEEPLRQQIMHGTTRAPSVLIICTYFPPQNSTATRRPYHLATRLLERGHKVSILTSALEPGTRWETDISRFRIHRLPLTRTIRKGNAVQRWLVHRYWSTQGRSYNILFRTLAFFFLPVDTHDRMDFDEEDVEHALGRHDVVISTGPRWSVVEFGHRLARRWAPTYIVDYRDPWNLVMPEVGVRSITWYGDGLIGWLKRRRMRRLEQRFTRLANAITSVSPTFLSNAILSTKVKRAGLIYNGANPAPVTASTGRNDAFTMLYSGRLYQEQEWDVLLRAMDIVQAEHPQEASRIRLVLLGPVAAHPPVLEGLVAYGARTGMIEVKAGVDRVEAQNQQSRADLLVNVSLRNISGNVPVKLLEYLHAGKPILQVSNGNDVQEAILKSTRAGEVIGDPRQLADYLLAQSRRWAAGEPLLYAPDRSAISEFHHERQMDKWVDLICEVHAEHPSNITHDRQQSIDEHHNAQA